ncbi:ParA family protein (plasmid) [Borrelia miyamotoi]|uniref:ParA family protein n=1 Tax=Borrelia miyamotoi TaxID=47466 RepID=A0A481YE04_9SPIR|nr:ParA family protein [Borrelia miyamotoi]QBK62638.1 ParA family protein [Borrelia miyamotoi]QBK65196.1 ParA family protein [Borrelia miyamotoi]WCB91133.1 ParA family protein [Borrelia miyamotoi]WDE70499.1 ParA family protein [Borrelia miyamotoi]WDE71854.1 ParA family protein [Borrelia miyamotoi]
MDREKPKIITIASIKGGVGKSTSAIIFATLLAQKHKVLLIDMDTQASTTSYFYEKIEKQNIDLRKNNIYEVLIDKLNINSSILNVKINLDLIPSYLTLHSINAFGYKHTLSEFKLKSDLKYLDIKYDYIVIDTPPSLDFTLTSSLICCNYVIVPMTAEKWTIESFDLLKFFMEKVALELPIFFIITRFKKNNTHKRLLEMINSKSNFLGTISEREDLNRRIAENDTFDFEKDYIKEYRNSLINFFERVD